MAFDLYFGSQPAASGILMTRVAGIALVSFGIACYPQGARQGFVGMLAFSVLITVYLIAMGVSGSAGILLWPGVAVHVLLSLSLIICARLEKRGNSASTR
ncbi:MAG TPA: hypothetical protein VHR97_05270 [Candidatus Baltobacteraceae bacterium]|nr:hypothetical protein [Candidatus Baltobacteraceae bacterium]